MGLSYYTVSFLGSDLIAHCFLNINEPMGFNNRWLPKYFLSYWRARLIFSYPKKVKSHPGSSDILAKYYLTYAVSVCGQMKSNKIYLRVKHFSFCESDFDHPRVSAVCVSDAASLL